jgi:diguanylate cyclase (GGDEF)-like protein
MVYIPAMPEGDLRDVLPIGTAVLDGAGRVLFWDDGAVRLLAIERADAVGRNFFTDLWKDSPVQPLLQLFASGLKDGGLDLEFDADKPLGRKVSTPIHVRMRDVVHQGKPCGLVLMEGMARRQRLMLDEPTTESELYRLATRDAATGLANRPFFVDLLTLELGRCRRSRLSGTFVLMLLDEGKTAPGSNEWTRLIGAVSRVLKRTARGTDLLSRLGSDRFGVFLTSTDLEGAARFIDRVRRSLASSARAAGGEGDKPAAFYFGIVAADDMGYRAQPILQASERAAGEAKRGAPGSAVIATPKSMEPLGGTTR